MRALQAPKEAGFDRPYRHMKPCRDFLITARLEKIEAEQLAAVLGSGVQHQARELSDAYVTQTVTPRYVIDLHGTTSGGEG